MGKPQFVYAVEIATSAADLWAALTSGRFWQQFSGPVESDWQVGSPVNFYLPEGKLYAVGSVLQSDPPHLLSHTWPDPDVSPSPAAPTQRLTWRIDPHGSGIVKLTLLHENLTDQAYQGVSQGWPVILGDLKRSLETPG
jgi:uncharacterized protein YndB with AHSA1/START domain